jgi:uncharacterized membrane protein YphA (DoxX/SURF4 family)
MSSAPAPGPETTAPATGIPAGRARALAGHVARLVLGLVFVAAGLLKALDPAEFARQVAEYGIVSPGVAAVAGPLLIALETTLGVALVAAFRPRIAAVVTAGLLLWFVALEAYGLAHGRTEACGCFGAYVQRTPAQVIIEDLVFLLLAGITVWGLAGRRESGGRAAPIAVATAAVLSLGFAFASPYLPLDPLVTRLAAGRTLADLGLAGKLSPRGRHLVALLDLADPGAAETAARLNAIAEVEGAPGVVVLTPSTEEEKAAFLWTAVPAFDVLRVDRPVLKPLFRRLPRYFLIDSGKVVSVYDGAPPQASDLLSSEAS